MSVPDPLASIRAALTARPVLIFLAGPNGSGKSTFYDEYLQRLELPYVNADHIAAILRATDATAPMDEINERAFTEAETLRRALVEAGLSFCTETVFSDPVAAKLRFLGEAKARGFAVFLVFIGLDNVELGVARVKHRAEHGGHNIPDDKLHARYPRTFANLRAAIPLVDEVFLLDNSSYDTPYRVVAVYREGQLVSQHPPVPDWTQRLPGL